MKILLVDDDPLQAFVRMSILKKRFRDVLRVNDAAEALCLVEQPQFAQSLGLVVSGHHLAGIGGPAFVAELNIRVPSVPVLVLGDSIREFAAYTGNQVSFLSTPIVPEEMLSLATRMMAESARQTA